MQSSQIDSTVFVGIVLYEWMSEESKLEPNEQSGGGIVKTVEPGPEAKTWLSLEPRSCFVIA